MLNSSVINGHPPIQLAHPARRHILRRSCNLALVRGSGGALCVLENCLIELEQSSLMAHLKWRQGKQGGDEKGNGGIFPGREEKNKTRASTKPARRQREGQTGQTKGPAYLGPKVLVDCNGVSLSR